MPSNIIKYGETNSIMKVHLN